MSDPTAPGDALDEPDRPLWQPMALCGAIALTLWIGLVAAWGDAPYTLTFDDAYYFFAIAENVADGHGFTFDRINETNGFMPLWQFVIIPGFALGLQGETAARVLLEVQLVLWLAASVVLARTVHDASPGMARLRAAGRSERAGIVVAISSVGFATLVASPYVLRTITNGLESGITAPLYVVLLAVAVRVRGSLLGATTTRGRLGLSVLLGLLFLGRTDVVVLLAALGLWTLAEARSIDRPVRRLFELFTFPAFVVIGYTAWNQVAFGLPIQISGHVKRVTPTGRDLIVLLVVVMLAGFVARRSWRRRVAQASDEVARFARVQAIWASTGWFAAFLLLTVGYYAVLSAQQWLWYFAPHVVYLLLLGAALFVDFTEAAIAEAPRRHSARRAVLPIVALFLLPLVASLVPQWQSLTNPDQRSIQVANREAGAWITANLPPDTVLASWDAGVVGYFSEQSIVNLDGVVNSLDWYEAMRDGTTGAFLDRSGVTYLVNHASMVQGEELGIDETVQRLFNDPEARAEQVHRVEFIYAGRIEGHADSGGPKPMAVFIHRVVRSDEPE